MAAARLASRILLIGWDAADWKFINPLLDAGLMPNLSQLVDGGAIANLATLQPCLSPILWTSIATGKTADKHGIAGFVEPIPGGGGVRLSSSTSRTTKALWNILTQNGLSSIIVNWYASHPAEPIRGVSVSNRFFEGYPRDPNSEWEIVPGSQHPVSCAATFADLRMHPAELSPRELSRFIPHIDQINLALDPRPAQLAEIMARTVSVHSVATAAMQTQPWDFFAVYYDGLDVAGHHFMPFHPPRMPNVSAADFAAYQHVMRELYVFHDEMLGRLLELAGDDVTVILLSDHGFHCDHLRPLHSPAESQAQAAAWHRQYGILAMRGHGLLQDERIYGATLLDITPTVLTLFGLPVGRDMDGRPLIQAFVDPPQAVRTVPSWDRETGEDGRHPVAMQQALSDSSAAVDQLIALGYLPSETAESRRAVEVAIAESQFNLAIVHSCHGRYRKSLELLEQLHSADPEHLRYAVALAKTYANLNEHSKSLAVIEQLESKGWHSQEADLLAAAALFNDGQVQRAFDRLAESERRYAPGALYWSLLGKLHLARGSWVDAESAFANAIALDDEDAHSHNGLAQAALQQDNYDKAAEHALRAVGLLFFFPQAHFHLGMAFKDMGDPARALESLKLAVAQAPRFAEAHHELEKLRQEQAEARRARELTSADS